MNNNAGSKSFLKFLILCSGGFIAAIGSGLTSFGLGVYVFERTGLSVSLFFAGLCMAGFGSRENIVIICVFGFLFFFMLPFANTSIDYLIRTNISNEVQSRVWALIGIISQFGYIIAYGTLGPLADYVFIPLLKADGALAGNVGKLIGTGSGRGIGLLIILAGILLAVTVILLYQIKPVKELENRGQICTVKS